MIKRSVDIVYSILGLMLFSPVLTLLAIIVKYKLGSPVLFKQQRPGLFGDPFTFYKFRTMRNELDKNGKLLEDKDRITSLGKVLRRASLDELPSLFNVLKGEMSLVGPRPLLVEYLPRYTQEQRRRHEVKPGITGWAQINGRNLLTWEEKFEYDVWYVENQSIWLDNKILMLTLKKVFIQEGINSQTSATMEKFKGSVPK